MARRRSQNRRASRKSWNITELDENSELVDTHDALWWKNIEGDMTVRRSRGPSYADTTASILDDNSAVETSELRDDWWKMLGRPSIDPSRRISVRRSIRATSTRDESSGSEASNDNVARKSRTSWLRIRDKKSVNNVSGFPSEPTIIADSQETGSSGEDETSRARSRHDETRENVAEMSVYTSDAHPNSRPKPFKKRFAKIPDGTFEEFGNEATGTNKSQEQRRADASLDGTPSRSVAKLHEPEGHDVAESSAMMGPPRSVSRRKRRASSIARKLETTSEESEPDAESKMRRSRVARKVRKTVSINPFDEVIVVNASERSEDSTKVSPINENIEKVKRGPSQMGRRSLSQRIEDESRNKEDENHPDTSFESSFSENKILEVSLTRLSPSKNVGAENLPAERSRIERNLRALKSRRRFIDESAYELPDQERSATPQISDEESPKEQSPGITESSKMPLQTPLNTNSTRKNLAVMSRRSLDYSRTKIFSDEDISLEDLSYMEKHRNLVMPEIEAIPVSRKCVPTSDEKSTRNARLHVNTSENKAEAFDPTNTNSINLHLQERSRKSAARLSGRSILGNKSRLSKESDASSNEEAPDVAGQKDFTRSRQDSRRSRASASRKSKIRERENRIDRTIGKKGIEVAEEINQKEGNSGQARLRGNSDVSEKAQNYSPTQVESPESPDERNNRGKSQSTSPTSRSTKESRKKPQRSVQNVQSPDEPEVAERMEPSNFSRVRENSRTSGKNLTAQESQRRIMFDESSLEDGEEAVGRTYRKSGYTDTTEKSVVEKSLAEKSVGEKSFAEKSVAKKSVTVKSVREKSVTKKLTAEAMVRDKSVAEKSFAERVAAKKSEAEKSMTEKSFNSASRHDASTSASVGDPAEEPEPRPKSSLKDVTQKSFVPVNESLEVSEDVLDEVPEDVLDEVPEDEPEKDPERQVSPRGTSRSAGRSFTANKSRRLMPSIGQDTRLEPEKSQNEDPKSMSSRAMSRASLESSEIDESHKGIARRNVRQRSNAASEEEADVMSTSLRPRSFVADLSRQSIRELEKMRLNEIENASESIAELPGKEKSTRKSASNARLSRNILATSHAANLRDSVTRANWKVESSTPKVATRASILSSSKTSTPVRAQTNITDFYPSKFLQKSHETATTRDSTPRFDPIKMKEVKEKVEEMKRRELEAMSLETLRDVNSKKRPFGSTRKAPPTKVTTSNKPTKIVDKAYIVDGKVYKRPRLPRPKAWATDRLYRYLWKRMEPKYKSSSRVKSEKFVLLLAKVVALAIRRKKYESYKSEVDTLMKEMATLGIIRTPNEFYDFCHEFMPYEFRVKVTPILLPGNEVTIPYDPDKLHTPILQDA